jgi:hypothetical protein
MVHDKVLGELAAQLRVAQGFVGIERAFQRDIGLGDPRNGGRWP